MLEELQRLEPTTSRLAPRPVQEEDSSKLREENKRSFHQLYSEVFGGSEWSMPFDQSRVFIFVAASFL